jgi:hypothetical protein
MIVFSINWLNLRSKFCHKVFSAYVKNMSKIFDDLRFEIRMIYCVQSEI